MTGPRKYVVAVSGGVDSVTLLHMLTEKIPEQLIVAHFDHGIRDDSREDAFFVRRLAEHYGVIFETKREDLGQAASEDMARIRRYEFLHSLAKKYDAAIVTAHHADDAVETVAINLTRGTGWRGLAVLDSDVIRPLLDMSKREIVEYAQRHHLAWHEDSTNASDAYLRNRIRRKTNALTDDTKRQILALRAHQVDLKRHIKSELESLVGSGPTYSRYFFSHVDHAVAIECLRYVVRGNLTRPQAERAVIAIKTAKAGTSYQAGSGVSLRFTSRNFKVELIK
jgi:tRNA(Ile)-lysidine synthase